MSEPVPVPPRQASVKPASYGVSLLLILFVLVLAQVAGEVLLGMRHSGEPVGGGSIALLLAGGAALLGLIVVNARWLWSTLGNLRFALALITLWALASILGTLVVQRVPNQTDEGYARTFTAATGDFLYNASHIGGGVVVQPKPEVARWFAEQARLFGPDEARELEKQWMGSTAGRLRQGEIERWIDEHETLLADVLAVVSWLRLPEAFQISVWFKALLGLLCTALVIVVIQRWRGEWRQIGWAMAHLGMVVFCIGASVRATRKVDGFMVMHTGETASAYERKVAPELLGRDPDVRVNGRGDASKLTPLDFEFTLHRFKTEYPKHLFVTFPEQQAEKFWLLSPKWKHSFLEGGLELRVASLRENVATASRHRERPAGAPLPALLFTITADWLRRPEQFALKEQQPNVAPDGSYAFEYRRAADEDEYARLLADASGQGWLWAVWPDKQGRQLGEVRPGERLELPEAGGLQARIVDVWPDWTQRADPDGHAAEPGQPAVELQLDRDGAPAGRLAVLADRMEALDGAPPPVELRFEWDRFATRAPVKYRFLDLAGRAPVLVTFRAGSVAGTQDVRVGDEVALGAAGDRLRLDQAFERHSESSQTAAADTSGMTQDDIYYASLPTEVVLEARGSAVETLAQSFDEVFRQGADPQGALGLVTPADFASGAGQMSVTDDGRGLLLRLVSDDLELGGFPSDLQAVGFRLRDVHLPFRLTYVTNDQGQPLRFTSDVSLTRDGKLLERALVEPNAPIYLAGFQFSQADFRKDDPTYSGFGVVRDPSVRIVYFGMGILVVGVILLFYVNPMLAKRAAGKLEALSGTRPEARISP